MLFFVRGIIILFQSLNRNKIHLEVAIENDYNNLNK